MSSTKFNVSPTTGGTGSTNVTVSSKGMNNTHADYKARITISDGTNTKNVNVTQYGVPTIYQRNGYSTISSSGGTLDFTVYSHYPFKFNNVPSYVSISDSRGNNYDDMPWYNPWIPAERATEPSTAISPNYFLITLAPNTGAERTTAGFNMSFEKDYFEQSAMTTPINITQLAVEEAPHMYTDPPILYMDYDDEQTRKINVGTNMRGWQTFLTGNTAFTISQSTSTGNGIVSATTLVWNSGTTFIRGNVKCTGTSAGTVYSASTQIVQYYEPKATQWGGMPTVLSTGGTVYIKVYCAYNWEWKNAIPDWITVTDSTGDGGNPLSPSPTGEAERNYYFHIAPNSGAERSYELQVKFYRHDGATGATLRNITITQRAPADSEYVLFYDQWNDRIDQLTFPYSATNGSARLLGVSANTRWSTSWVTGDYFDLPYAETGTTGGQFIQVNYVGPRDDSSAITDTLLVDTVGGNQFSVMIKKPKKPTISLWHDTYEVPSTGGTKYFMLECDYPYWITPQPIPSYIHWYDYDGNPLSGDSTNPNTPPVCANTLIYATWDAIPDGSDTRNDYFNLWFMSANDTMEKAYPYEFARFTQSAETSPEFVKFYYGPMEIDELILGNTTESGDTFNITISASSRWNASLTLYDANYFSVSPISTDSAGATNVTITYKGPYDPNTLYRCKLVIYSIDMDRDIWIRKMGNS